MGFYNDETYLGEDVKGRDVILFNNLIRSGKNFRFQSNDLKKKGAKNIYCFGFHGLCAS
jgi:phosphoribosylpyrophosphate synthetase